MPLVEGIPTGGLTGADGERAGEQAEGRSGSGSVPVLQEEVEGRPKDELTGWQMQTLSRRNVFR